MSIVYRVTAILAIVISYMIQRKFPDQGVLAVIWLSTGILTNVLVSILEQLQKNEKANRSQ